MSIGQVIGWKFNNQEGMSTNGDVITEFPNGIPTQADQDLWTSEYETHLEANEYKGLRAEAYPSLAEQADMAYWDRQNGTTTLDDAISAVKLQFPKG
jgi:hypothetical protein